MRTGAIFARGSCRALKWMALLGMVLALGAGQAAAQITVDGPDELTEGVAATFEVEFDLELPASTTAGTLILRVAATGATPATHVIRVNYDANTSTTDVVETTEERSFTITPSSDDDADDGTVGLAYTLDTTSLLTHNGATLEAPADQTAITVKDDETRGYILQLITRAENRQEAKEIEYRIEATHPFATGASQTVELELDKAYVITGSVTAGANAGEATAAFSDSAQGPFSLMYTAPKDDDTDDQVVTLTAYWGTNRNPGTASHSVRLVDPDDDPDPAGVTFTTEQADISATVGMAVSLPALPAATGGIAPITYTTTALPPGLMFTASTRMITGTPTMAGTTAVTYTATDSATPTPDTEMMTFNIVVAGGTTPPPTTAAVGTFSLSASKDMTEGQSLVPVSVTYTVPAVARGTRSGVATVTVSVMQLTDAEISTSQGATIAVLESMQPPVTRAELGSGVGSAAQAVNLTAAGSDVEWMPNTVGDVTISNSTGMAMFVFDYGEDAFNKTHTAYLRTHRDSDDAEDELFHLEAMTAHTGVSRKTGNKNVVVKIDDVQTQTYEVDFPGNNDDEINEGQAAGLEVVAVPDRTVDIPFNVTLSADKDVTDYSLDSNPAAISQNYTLMAGQTKAFTINTKAVDGDREDDTVTALVQTMNQPGTQRPLVEPSFELDVIDLHKLPKITLTKIQVPDADDKLQDATAIPEGKIGTVTLTADRSPADVPDSEVITVTLSHADESTADTRDYTLVGGSEVKFTATGKTTTFKVDVDADEDVRGESLVLVAAVEGTKANGPNPDDPYNLAAIPFGDETVKHIQAKSYADIEAARDKARTEGAGANGLWEPGETLTLKASDLFTYAATATVNLSVGRDHDLTVLSAATSGDMVTVTAQGDGESPISITGTVVTASPLEVTQTTSTEVTVKFPIMVDAPAITKKDNLQAVADAAIAKAAEASANGIWEPAPNGAVAMVALSDLFDVPESINDEYLARSSDTADVQAAISSDMMYVELTPMGAGMATITVTAVDSDRPGNAVTIDFTATVVAQASIRALSQAEVDKAFMDAGAGDLVAQGAAITLDASGLFEVGPGVTPTYSAASSDADALMASVGGTMLTLTPGQAAAGGMSTITVTALDAASGSHASVMHMATVDALPAMITVSTDPMDMVEEGGSITVTAMLNQKAAADMTVTLQVTGPATPAEAEIMLMTGMESASTMLMASNDYDPMSDWNDIVIVASHEAIMGGSAVMTLSVTENDSEITYTLAGPEDMNLVEGSEYELTVTAEPAVPMDTEVMIMRDRANSDADEDDYTVEPIMIMAGETSGSTMLMVTEDNMDDSGHASPEMLTLFGMVGNMQTNSVSVYLWDMAVPALPVIAQLLLAAFLAIGGYRRYLRR